LKEVKMDFGSKSMAFYKTPELPLAILEKGGKAVEDSLYAFVFAEDKPFKHYWQPPGMNQKRYFSVEAATAAGCDPDFNRHDHYKVTTANGTVILDVKGFLRNSLGDANDRIEGGITPGTGVAIIRVKKGNQTRFLVLAGEDEFKAAIAGKMDVRSMLRFKD
jgi:hypothetical protein